MNQNREDELLGMIQDLQGQIVRLQLAMARARDDAKRARRQFAELEEEAVWLNELTSYFTRTREEERKFIDAQLAELLVCVEANPDQQTHLLHQVRRCSDEIAAWRNVDRSGVTPMYDAAPEWQGEPDVSGKIPG